MQAARRTLEERRRRSLLLGRKGLRPQPVQPSARTQIAEYYSLRSAVIGGMAAARTAGIIAAQAAQTASESAAVLSASGSQNGTPYNWAASSRPAPTASGRPSNRPITTRRNA